MEETDAFEFIVLLLHCKSIQCLTILKYPAVLVFVAFESEGCRRFLSRGDTIGSTCEWYRLCGGIWFSREVGA